MLNGGVFWGRDGFYIKCKNCGNEVELSNKNCPFCGEIMNSPRKQTDLTNENLTKHTSLNDLRNDKNFKKRVLKANKYYKKSINKHNFAFILSKMNKVIVFLLLPISLVVLCIIILLKLKSKRFIYKAQKNCKFVLKLLILDYKMYDLLFISENFLPLELVFNVVGKLLLKDYDFLNFKLDSTRTKLIDKNACEMEETKAKQNDEYETLFRNFLRCKSDYLSGLGKIKEIRAIKQYTESIYKLVVYQVKIYESVNLRDLTDYLNDIEAFYYNRYGMSFKWNNKKTFKLAKRMINEWYLLGYSKEYGEIIIY